MNVEYKIIGNTIPFSKSIELYKRSAYIGPTDDGWSEIVKVDEQYYCEDYYKSLLDMGYKPQEARVVLPNATKTELVMTGFESDWENFFELRCSKAAHPDAQKLANELKELLINVKKY